ncbi:hypothetical protein MRX96_018623 [Rhipicephalus microplus]
MESSSQAERNDCVEAVREVDNKQTMQAEINALQQTPSVSEENYNPEPAESATPKNMQASGNALAGEPAELATPENMQASGYALAGELFPEDEPEEAAGSPANEDFTQFTIERLGGRVRRMAEKIAEDTDKVSRNYENLVIRVSARRDDLLRRNKQ